VDYLYTMISETIAPDGRHYKSSRPPIASEAMSIVENMPFEGADQVAHEQMRMPTATSHLVATFVWRGHYPRAIILQAGDGQVPSTPRAEMRFRGEMACRLQPHQLRHPTRF
jgi:hypothetical protein